MQLARAIASEDPAASADAAALHYATDAAAGIERHRHGKSFTYTRRGMLVRDAATLARIRKLAIPPAWTDVWISSDPDAHLQATGRDARGRKQYRYHPRWREVRDATKYHRLAELIRALPKIRTAVARDLARHDLDKRKVVATIVSLMETAQLRVGNEEYARQNDSYGATTLRNRHARIHGNTLELSYRAKSGIERRVRVSDRKLARIVRRVRDLPGQRLFQYVDERGRVRPVSSGDVNDYLRETSGGPFTAKDYRTWAATCAAAMLLCAADHPGTERACKRSIKQVLEQVASRLGHTVAICRSSYVHPRLLEDFTSDHLRTLRNDVTRRLRRVHESGDPIALEALRAVETAVARYLERAV